jgi:carboxylesterase type B
MFSNSILWALCLCLANSSVAQYTVGKEVKTSSGDVQGHAAKGHPEVSEYLGIRFGQSTEGLGRFMPPKPFNSTEKIVASDYVPAPH